MSWAISTDERVSQAIISAFCDSADCARARLSALTQHDWERNCHWLIASGMTLYLLDQVESLGIENALPEPILGWLRQNLLDHRKLNEFMMAEFLAINRALLLAGVTYCNLKGFTLSPDYCPDPVLRSQLDFDLMVDGGQLELCRAILEERGYQRTEASRNEWIFKADASEMVRIEDHFKLRPHRIVELHFSTSGDAPSRDKRLDRLSWRAWEGNSLPVLSPADQFVEQALHLLSHLRSPSTRPAWLLEYKRFVSAHEEDIDLWDKVYEASRPHRQAPVAIGLASLLATQFFGGRTPAPLDAWTLDRLPKAVRRWAGCYGRRAVFAGPPGTKLYLLLEPELESDGAAWARKRRRRLVPLRRVPRILPASPREGLWKRVCRAVHQTRFTLYRIRFHLIEDLRYLAELPRWKRLLDAEQHVSPQMVEDPALRKS